jgi:Domain of unknown function (DUF6265)
MKSPQSNLWLRLACAMSLFLGGLQSPAMAQQPAGSGTQAASAPPAAPESAAAPAAAAVDSPQPKASIADFSWLEGRWQGTWGPRVAEQTWLAPKAGTMLGTFRLVENEKVLVLEVFTLVQKPEGIDFYFRHFTPELVPWEKTDATILKLTALDAKRADFENPVNGQPKHSILTRVDADTYTSRSEIVPEQGDPQTIEITYHRVKGSEAKPNAGNGGRR